MLHKLFLLFKDHPFESKCLSGLCSHDSYFSLTYVNCIALQINNRIYLWSFLVFMIQTNIHVQILHLIYNPTETKCMFFPTNKYMIEFSSFFKKKMSLLNLLD